MPHRSPHRRLAPAAFFLSVLLCPVGPLVHAASAAGAAALDPSTIVSRDGQVYPAAPLSALESRPFHGTGALPEGMHAGVVSVQDLDAIPLEIDQDGNLIDGVGSAVAGTESVIDTDERHQVTDTSAFPFRAIVSLIIKYGDNDAFICTGFFIDADTVATAGHCVYSHDKGSWATSIVAYPGRNGGDAPYGSTYGTNVWATSGWYNDADHTYDYGAIKLNAALGNTVGWFGYGVKSDSRLPGVRVRIFGYPADKPSGTMWGTKRKIKGVEAQKLYYKIDTYGGQSGSPIYGKLSNTCQTCAFGIHAYGVGIEPYPDSNSGTRFSDSVFANLAFWATQ
jgi:glutamyl endopeptidase